MSQFQDKYSGRFIDCQYVPRLNRRELLTIITGLSATALAPPANAEVAMPPMSRMQGLATKERVIASDAPEVFTLAALMTGEARGEDRPGKIYVGEVAMNRVKSSRYPDTVKEVALQHKQFSCFNDGYKEAPQLLALALGQSSGRRSLDHSFLQILPLAEMILNGYRSGDISQGVLHYYAHATVLPYWASTGSVQLVHGGHTFMTGVA